MPPAQQRAVKVLLSSGATRIIDDADSARLDDAFFIVRSRDRVVVTLWSQNVIGAEILTDGVRTGYVPGKGAAR